MPKNSQLRLATPPSNPSRLLFESPLVKVGIFRCPTSHPRFGDSEPTASYCFVFPRTAVWIEHEGSRPFVADSTVVPLYNVGHPYKRRRICEEGDRTDWFGVAPALLREMLASHGSRTAEAERRLFPWDFARIDAHTFLVQRGILRHVRRTEPIDTLFVEESVIGVLDQVLTNGSQPALPPGTHQHRELAEEARAHLNLTFAKSDGLTALARAVQSSVFHLCRVFRAHAGVTIHRYRGQLRLRKSLELIGDREEDILTTALALGYSGHSHFTGAFHRTFGIKPSEFRALSRQRRINVAAAFRSISAPS